MKGSVHTDYAFNSVLQTIVTSDLHKLDAVGPWETRSDLLSGML